MLLQINFKSSKSRASHQLASSHFVPQRTARASLHEFYYVFTVTRGQNIIRLHFYQDSYKGLKRFKALFTVKAGAYALLSNFTSDVLGTKHIVKEFCINIDDGQTLAITFSPAQKVRKSVDFYAFVNVLRLSRCPLVFTFTAEGELGARVVGQYRFYIDNSTVLELIQRLNLGGASVSPAEDSRMFRRWDDDSNYLFKTGAAPD